MKVQRGDVVMVDWLYSDRTGSKRRPALVVQADAFNQTLDNTILAMITSSANRRVGTATNGSRHFHASWKTNGPELQLGRAVREFGDA